MPAPLVLVVDDEPSVQQFLDRLLQLHGFEVMAATTVAEAIVCAEKYHVDAVVLDLALKGQESGLDLLGWLRNVPEYSNTPILILTGRAALPEDEEVLIRRQHAYVFYKPQPSHVLVEYLKRLTDGS